jgi:hypothetical protein
MSPLKRKYVTGGLVVGAVLPVASIAFVMLLGDKANANAVQGKSHLAASFSARDTMGFSLQGT